MGLMFYICIYIYGIYVCNMYYICINICNIYKIKKERKKRKKKIILFYHTYGTTTIGLRTLYTMKSQNSLINLLENASKL